MKKLSIAIALVAVLAGTSAFANPDASVSAIVEKAFLKNFAGAESVSWELTPDFYFARFLLNGKETDAAFNEEGDLLGVSTSVQLSELPENVKLSLKTQYPAFLISTNATEVNFEGKVFYNVVAENQKRVLRLKCMPGGKIFVESRSKK